MAKEAGSRFRIPRQSPVIPCPVIADWVSFRLTREFAQGTEPRPGSAGSTSWGYRACGSMRRAGSHERARWRWPPRPPHPSERPRDSEDSHMASPQGDGNAPSWLFSFVDLAFLMVIAMTQIANPGAVDLGELIVPRIASEQTEAAPPAARKGWQLRVHPPVEFEGPFQLVRSSDAVDAVVTRLDEEALRERLAELDSLGSDKPALAPHEDSRSHDMLKAVELLETHWPTRRRALVERVFAQR